MFTLESSTAAVEPKHLYRLVEPAFADLPADEPSAFYLAAIQRTRERFGDECGIEGTAVLRREGVFWRPLVQVEAGLAPVVSRLDTWCSDLLKSSRVAFVEDPFPMTLWLLGNRQEWLSVFRLARMPDERQSLLLQMARLAVQQRALEMGWTGLLDRARAIQRSLLPDPLPELSGFDLAARSESAEEVGGDVFDVLRLGPHEIGLMIADAVGHGFPAALEARDVVVGLRMGAARHLKIDATIERLNRILCGSTLSSRFVSLVYGELSADGSFDYINAGHPAPAILSAQAEAPLHVSGRVLGVSPDSRYRVGHAQIPPDGLLLLFTDGVTECPSPAGEEFGLGRLLAIASALRDSSAAHIVSMLFEALQDHAGGIPPPDDASILVARRIE